MKIRARIVNEAARQFSFPSRSASHSNVIYEWLTSVLTPVNEDVRYEWLTSVLTPVNEGVYAMQYENKDAEVQTTYT